MKPAEAVSFDTTHDEMIHDVQMDHNGRLIATCSSDHTVKISSPTPGQPQSYTVVATLKGHDGPVWQVGWAPPRFGNGLLASCSYDSKVILWKETADHVWTKAHEYTKHNASVNALDWGPADMGLCLATASSDGTVGVLWHQNTWNDHRWEAHQGGCNAVSWAPYLPTGALLTSATATAPSVPARYTLSRALVGVSHTYGRIASGGCDHLIKLWRYVDGAGPGSNWQLETSLNRHTDWVRDVKWAPNLGLPFTSIASGGQDGRVCVWTQKTDEDQWEHHDIPNNAEHAVWKVSWSELGNILAVSAADNVVTMWRQDATSGTWVCMSTVTPPSTAAS